LNLLNSPVSADLAPANRLLRLASWPILAISWVRRGDMGMLEIQNRELGTLPTRGVRVLEGSQRDTVLEESPKG
jgi:hypothetical protein